MPIAEVSTINRYVFMVTAQKRSAEGAHTICWSSEMETPDDSVRASRIEARLEVCMRLVSSNTPLQTVTRPRAVAKCFTFADGRAFVSVSATILSVGQ